MSAIATLRTRRFERRKCRLDPVRVVSFHYTIADNEERGKPAAALLERDGRIVVFQDIVEPVHDRPLVKKSLDGAAGRSMLV
ncbi:MAG: hypothetical protein U5Q44_09675 [Dehalococcoidia bacterium]|nr:hypothetical protein [Dehalococcoidia bacterium]